MRQGPMVQVRFGSRLAIKFRNLVQIYKFASWPDQRQLLIASAQPFYVGNEAQVKERILKLKCPIDNGHITNVDEMEQIW